jgi:hypothetical protein
MVADRSQWSVGAAPLTAEDIRKAIAKVNEYPPEPRPMLDPIHPKDYEFLQRELGKVGQPLTEQEVIEWAWKRLLKRHDAESGGDHGKG